MELPSEIADREVTLEDYLLIVEGVNKANPAYMEHKGELPAVIENYGYGAKENAVDAAETVLKVVDEPSWETVFFAQSFLMGGRSNEQGVKLAVNNIEDTPIIA